MSEGFSFLDDNSVRQLTNCRLPGGIVSEEGDPGSGLADGPEEVLESDEDDGEHEETLVQGVQQVRRGHTTSRLIWTAFPAAAP